MAYDQSQPRAAAGTPSGGQWSGAGYDARVNEALGVGVETSGLTYDPTRKIWVDRNGKPVDPRVAARLKEAKMPPAYIATINPDPDGEPLAVGYSPTTGEWVRKYSAAHFATTDVAKFERVRELNKVLPQLRDNLRSAVADGSLTSTQRDTAAALLLVERTGIRPGSSDTVDHGSYGASTIEGRHIGLVGDNVSIRFVGKSGKTNVREFKDEQLADYVRLKIASNGVDSPVFNTSDSLMRDSMKRYSGDKAFKTKDLRTWWGTATAVEAVDSLIKSGGWPKTDKELRTMQSEVARRVSSFLNNTPAVALAKYIDPAVFPQVGEGEMRKKVGNGR
jgi:DNA topoisomerase-1